MRTYQEPEREVKSLLRTWSPRFSQALLWLCSAMINPYQGVARSLVVPLCAWRQRGLQINTGSVSGKSWHRMAWPQSSQNTRPRNLLPLRNLKYWEEDPFKLKSQEQRVSSQTPSHTAVFHIEVNEQLVKPRTSEFPETLRRKSM